MLWTAEQDRALFQLFKDLGAHWTKIAKEFPGRNENEVKNRFYSTLRRVANTQQGKLIPEDRSKTGLLKYVDFALENGHFCASKRGRKRKSPTNRPEANPQDIVPTKKRTELIEENKATLKSVEEQLRESRARAENFEQRVDRKLDNLIELQQKLMGLLDKTKQELSVAPKNAEEHD